MTSRKHRFRPEVKEGRRPLSKKHPIIAVTGASGSGRGPIKEVFDKIFKREGIAAAFIDGASFHRYDRAEMDALTDQATALGDHSFSHFGPSANLLHELEALFARFAATGTGRRRHFLHSEEDARRHGCPEIAPGGFTPWEDLPDNAEVLLYEGFHGVVKTDDLDVGRHVDLKIGVTPIINLEWIRKVHRDTNNRGYSEKRRSPRCCAGCTITCTISCRSSKARTSISSRCQWSIPPTR